MKKSVTILAVGKIKTPHWQDAARVYIHRLQYSWQLKLVSVREAREHDPAERNSREGANLLAARSPGEFVIALDETGKQSTSAEFAGLLANCWEQENRSPCFVIGGAFGLSPEVKHSADYLLSFGKMTFPHELAQVFLLEQLYRADTIMRGAPYHH